MGSPTFYWTPDGAPYYKAVSLPNVQQISRAPYREVLDAEGSTMTRLDRGGGQLVNIRSRLNVANHAAIIRKLQTMDSHLRSGGRVSFLGDGTKGFCAVTSGASVSGDTKLTVEANALQYSNVSLVTGDEILIQLNAPLHYERAVLSADQTALGGRLQLTLSSGVYNEIPAGAVVRWWRCFPVLYMDASTANSPERWLRDERYPGLIYDLDLTLVELPAEVASVANSGDLANANLSIGQGGKTLNSLLSQRPDFGMRDTPVLDNIAKADLSGRWT
jgi:hypothetical protein